MARCSLRVSIVARNSRASIGLRSRCSDHQDPDSFPTRRSSDLTIRAGSGSGGAGGTTAADETLDNAHLMRLAGRFAQARTDRKSTRLNSSHGYNSYAVFCSKKKIDSIAIDA